jgi:hypothetical protein
VRRAILGIVIAFAASGCAETGGDAPAPRPPFEIRPTGSPFLEVTAGPVQGLVPERWGVDAYTDGIAREGFVATPDPELWRGVGGGSGISASWVDATDVGLASDLFYLAATGPMFGDLDRSVGCEPLREVILVDRAPAFLEGRAGSPGDFVARGEGVCHTEGGAPTRWSYFVAAPGYGPTRTLGIPSSGLYVIVAVTRESPRASQRLAHLIRHVRFGGSGIGDFAHALR